MIKPSLKLIYFIQILASSDFVSKEDIKEKLIIRESAFYKHLAEIRKLFPVECVGSVGSDACYSIDKKTVAKFFFMKKYPNKTKAR